MVKISIYWYMYSLDDHDKLHWLAYQTSQFTLGWLLRYVGLFLLIACAWNAYTWPFDFRSQLSTPWAETSSRTKSYYRKQTYEIVKELVELIAPQQSTVILTEILQKHFSSDSDCDDYFISMVASYQEAGSPFLKQ